MIEYRIVKSVPPADMERLYRAAGWLRPEDSPEILPEMARNSFAICGAFDGNTLVGMMRTLSDGLSDAYLLDLVVEPEYRGQGIGRAIVKTLNKHLQSLGLDWIVCIGVPGTETFYKQCGAVSMTDYAPMRFH